MSHPSAAYRFRVHAVQFMRRACVALAAAGLAPGSTGAHAAELVQTIERIKPSIVAIGTFLKVRSPNNVFTGTGFVVADGRHVVTNAHVVLRPLDEANRESRVVIVSRGGEPVARSAELLAVDKDHDIALLRIAGEPLPAMRLGDSTRVREGQNLAFTGFPIGMALGFHPATHRGMVSTITPIALPTVAARDLTAKSVARIRDNVYRVFQLDGTAYPGNSGSPLYDPEDGTVYGIINSVFIQGTREAAISKPSGITYAIPGQYIRDMLREAKVPGFE